MLRMISDERQVPRPLRFLSPSRERRFTGSRGPPHGDVAAVGREGGHGAIAGGHRHVPGDVVLRRVDLHLPDADHWLRAQRAQVGPKAKPQPKAFVAVVEDHGRHVEACQASMEAL